MTKIAWFSRFALRSILVVLMYLFRCGLYWYINTTLWALVASSSFSGTVITARMVDVETNILPLAIEHFRYAGQEFTKIFAKEAPSETLTNNYIQLVLRRAKWTVNYLREIIYEIIHTNPIKNILFIFTPFRKIFDPSYSFKYVQAPQYESIFTAITNGTLRANNNQSSIAKIPSFLKLFRPYQLVHIPIVLTDPSHIADGCTTSLVWTLFVGNLIF